MTGPRDPESLLAAYRHGPGLLRQAIEGMDAEALRARPVFGKMSTLEVVCHVVDADQYLCDRMKRTVATHRPLLIGVESADYPGPLRYHDRDVDLDLRLLSIQREQMAADLERQPAHVWDRTAVHSENGLQTLHDLLRHAVDHLESHLASIAEKRSVLESQST